MEDTFFPPNASSTSSYPWNSQREKIKTVIIEEGVTSIGAYAFYGCMYLTSVSIPNSVISIGHEAFFYCESLKSLNIPNSVTNIGWAAFMDCKSLTSVTIPKNVTSIEKRTFYECLSLASVTIPNGVISIGEGAFYNCSLISLTIPNSVTSIGPSAFSNCGVLTSVSIPNSVTCIEASTFSECGSLASINIPNSVTSIGNYAFYYCYSLTSITIPNSVTSIGDHTFKFCTRLSSVTIPNSVTCIGDSAFSGCYSLPSVTIPYSVIRIGEGAFNEGFNNPKEVIIYANADLRIESHVFSNSGMKIITMYGETLPAYTAKDFSNGNEYFTTTLSVPSRLYDEYCNTEPWSHFSNLVKNDDGFSPISSIILEDGESYINKSKLSGYDISYIRTFNITNWQALYIPFSMSYDDWKDDFEVAYINGVRQLDKDDNGTIDETIMDVIKIKSGSTTPNMPYLIKAKTTGEKTFSVNDATLYPAEENSIDCSTTIAKYTFTGTYNTIPSATMIANNYYGMGGGELVQSDGSNDLKPYRWYMKVESRNPSYNASNAAKTITINVIDDEGETTTGVEELQMTNYKSPVYDLNGRKVNENNLKPGIYVKNGKKFVVK